jgi:hypothetical protein
MTDPDPFIAFAGALAAFQVELPHIAKGQRATAGPFSYDYADLTDITKQVTPLLAKHGLSWTARPHMTDHGFVLRSALLHSGGWREEGDYPLPDPSKTDPQKLGSAITYARRYSFTALTGVAPGGDDDDGKKALDARAAVPQTRNQPEHEVRTDAVWLTEWEDRVRAAGTVAQLRTLWDEVAAKARAGQVNAEDMEHVASRVYRERQNELRNEPPF